MMHPRSRPLTCTFTLLGLLALMLLSGCGKVVPPGNKVVIQKANGTTEIIEKGVFLAWGRDRAYFVDGKLQTYSMDLPILCADDINMTVRVKWLGHFKVDDASVETIVSKVPTRRTNIEGVDAFQLSLDDFWTRAMEDIVSSNTRQIISVYRTDDIRPNREQITIAIRDKVIQRFQELRYPIATTDVLITNLDYPESVTRTRERIKQAELKELENAALAEAAVAQARRDAEIAAERGKAALVAAEADAAVNRARAASLTPEILMVKQLEMFEKLANGPNNSSILIPFQAIDPSMVNTMMLKESVDRLAAPEAD